MIQPVEKLQRMFPYYGAKANQTMIKYLNYLTSGVDFNVYVEPFAGSGSVFWILHQSGIMANKLCCINDRSNLISNLWSVIMADDHQKKLLNKLVKSEPHSQAMHKYCIDRISPYMKEPLTPISFNEELAFCTWYVLCTSFNSAMDGGFGYGSSCPIPSGSTNKETKKLITYREAMLNFSAKLERVQIFNDDALVVLDRFCKNKENSKTLIYIDPPYVGYGFGKENGKKADQGWYAGYTENQYIDLLDWLSNFDGMFFLSNYPSEILKEYVMENGWNYHELDLQSSANVKNNKSRKIEAITWNYSEQKTLFGGL